MTELPTTLTELFRRDGRAFTGAPQRDAKGRPFITERRKCGRCGGQGRSEAWKYTGSVCYQCGGACYDGVNVYRLYDAEQLARLNKSATTRAVRKAAKAEAAAAVVKAAVDARRASFDATYGDLMTSAATYVERSAFVADVVRKARARAELTEGQEIALRNAIEKFRIDDAKKVASAYVGNVGERIEATVTAERVLRFEGHYGATYIATMRDGAGNAIVSKGRFVPPSARWNRDLARFDIDQSETFRIRATVKDHGVYRDEKQTTVQRVAELADATATGVLANVQ